MHIKYFGICKYKYILCKQANFVSCTPKISFLLGVSWSLVITPNTPFVSSCLWNWLCFSNEHNTFSSRSLFSVWPFLTEVYCNLHPYLPRTQVSYSSVVECVLFAVQGNESDCSSCLQLSMACDACTCFKDWAHDSASHSLKQLYRYWDQQDLCDL